MKAIAYLPVKYYSYPLWKRPSLIFGNYRQMRRLGASKRLAVSCAITEAVKGCTIHPTKRPSRVIDNLGLVIKLDGR